MGIRFGQVEARRNRTAGLLALGGVVAYLAIGGTLWWWLGLAAVVPLFSLMIGRLSEDDDAWPPATGGDGPWGAP